LIKSREIPKHQSIVHPATAVIAHFSTHRDQATDRVPASLPVQAGMMDGINKPIQDFFASALQGDGYLNEQ
jgi:hypothetical protein